MTIKHVQHVKSSVKTKVPTSDNLLYGEIGINYASDDEQIFIKNSSNNIVNFRTDAQNHSMFIDSSGDTVNGNLIINGDLSYKDGTNNINVKDKINSKLDTILGSGYTKSTGTTEAELTIVTGDSVTTAIGKIAKSIEDNEKVTAAALNEENNNITYIRDVLGQSDNHYIPNTGAKYINTAVDLNDADVILDSSIKGIHLTTGTSTNTNISKVYRLVDTNGNQLGSTLIDIEKDRFLQSALYNSGSHILTFTFVMSDGSTSAVPVDLSGLVDVATGENVMLTNFSKGTDGTDIVATDSVNAALSKVEVQVTNSKVNNGRYIKISGATNTVNLDLPIGAGPVEGGLILGIGEKTVSNGWLSLAAGEETSATNNSSHAEGTKTQATGVYSHAEGGQTTAASNSSHSEGVGTGAMERFSHAEGFYTKTFGNSSHSEGNTTTANGDYSHAEGANTIANGNNSHSEGHLTIANNGSHTEGELTSGNGYYSHAEGYSTYASGLHSHSEGENTNASGIGSHAEGLSAITNGNYSHAEGGYAQYGNTYLNIANGDYSHVEGRGNSANGYSSHAEGSLNEANGYCSHVEGYRSHSNNYYSHAEGSNTYAEGEYSHTEGNHMYSDALVALGTGSHAEGKSTSAFSDFSHAEGINTITTNYGEHAQGNYNKSVSASTTFGNSGNTLFSVGIGTSVDDRKNALEIRQNGDTYISGKTYISDNVSVVGTVTANGSIYSSDERLKENIKQININDIIKVSDVDLKQFNFKNDTLQTVKYGVIAQDLESVGLYSLVKYDNNGMRGVDYISFLILKIAQLEDEINELKNQMNGKS